MKTFSSFKHKFEIDIPEDWAWPSAPPWARLLGLEDLTFKSPDGECLDFQIGPLYPEPSLNETALQFQVYAQRHGCVIEEMGSIEVLGEEHFTVRYQANPGEKMANFMRKEADRAYENTSKMVLKKYCLVFKGTEYAITCGLGIYPDDEDEELKEREALYDEIVQTLRFV